MPDWSSPPAPSQAWSNFFSRYSRTYLRLHFHAVRLARANRPAAADTTAPAPPTIVYLNHPSWWDPLACVLLARELFPKRQHYGAMDAAMLQRYRIFKRLGIFGVEKGRRGSADFLRNGAAALARPGAILWLTPQGRFADARQRPPALAPGLAHLLRRCGQSRVRAYPLAVELTFWEERTPEMLLRLGAPLELDCDAPPSANALATRLEQRLVQTQDDLAADSITRNANAFDVLVRGRSGIGGMYDCWRRGMAALRRQPFQQQHGNL